VPHTYIHAVDALDASGDGMRAGAVAEDAYRRFADHPDRTIAALVRVLAAARRAIDSPADGLPVIREALRLYEGTPPSAEHAEAWSRYANDFLWHGEGQHPEEILNALHRALELAQAAGEMRLMK
jgi:hypothetical protein